MKTKYVYFACALVIALLGGTRIIQAATELARVNNMVITLEDFNKKFHENMKYFPYKAPTKKNVLDDLIKRELGIQEARKMGLDRDPEVVDRMNTVLYHALLDRKLTKEFEGIHISDSEAKSYYDKNPEIRTSHIFVAVPADAKPADQKAAYEKIKKIYDEQVRPGKLGFAEVAQRFSEGVAAPMGGDIDYQTKDKLDPTYYAEAVRLRSPGKTTGIVRSQFGYHIIKLTAMRSWDEVDHAQVKRLVLEEKRAEIFDRYMDQLRKQAKVNINSGLLKD